MAVYNYSYGIPYFWSIHDFDAASDQLWAANRLRNDLVAIYRDADQQRQNLWSTYPTVKRAEDMISELDAEAEQLGKAVKKARSESRTKNAGPKNELAARRPRAPSPRRQLKKVDIT